jgi:uncharacterized protein (TIGR01777 family)
MAKQIAITGATGIIGQLLVRELLDRGDRVTVLSRSAQRARAVLGEVEAFEWTDPTAGPAPVEALAGRDAVVNLMGEPVAQRWNTEVKERIRNSREAGTRHLVDALREADPRPAVLVSGSATGWYGPHGDEPLDESAPPARGDFLADVTVDWENEARRAEELGVRVVTIRTGVVLSENGGALEKMLPPFKMGMGGPIAGGRQYVPWVHAEDVVGAILFCLGEEAASGPVNVTAPEPVTNRELSKALGRVLGRPAVAPVPALALKALYGDMSEIITTGHRAIPRRLLDLGYRFRRPELEGALREATGK